MWTLGILEFGAEGIAKAVIGILLFIDSLIFGLICSSFRVFTAIAGARLLSSDAYTAIANKIYVIIGVVMLFVLAYAIIRAIIDPDQMTKGDLSAPKIIKNVVVAVIGLAIAPVLFNMMYQAQGLFLEHDVLVKIFFRTDQDNINLGSQSVGDTQVDIGTIYPNQEIDRVGGSVTALSLWTAFFYPDAEAGATSDNISVNTADYYVSIGAGVLCGVAAVVAIVATIGTFGMGTLLAGAAAGAVCAGAASEVAKNVDLGLGDEMTLSQAYNVASTTADFGVFITFSDFVVDGQIKYIAVVSTICGGFICYAFVSFTIDMGVRAAKLAYYQIIAPIPLILQVLPKWKDTFSKYLREVINTFIEVFVRISVVYIIIYIICHLGDLFSNMGALFGNKDLNFFEASFAYALLIIGLVIFAKQAPKLISETFGLKSGSMSLGIGKKLAEGGVYTAGGAIGGAVTTAMNNYKKRKKENDPIAPGALRSAAAGFISGAVRGGIAAKDAKKFSDMRTAASNGAYAASKARDKHDSNRKRKFDALDPEMQKRITDAQNQLDAAEAELDAAIESNDDARIEAAANARERAAIELNKARGYSYKKAMLKVGIEQKKDDFKEAYEKWSVGSVDLSREEADINFAKALKKTKDDARDVAYGKDSRTKSYKQQYERAQAREIDEYREGWNKQSFDAAVQEQVSSELSDLTSKRLLRQNALDELQRARTNGADADTILSLENAYNAAVAGESTALTNFNIAKDRVVRDLEKVAKRDKSELAIARADLQREVDLLKDLMEASADEYVASQIGVVGSDVNNIITGFLDSQADYIKANSTRGIATEVDSLGNVVKSETISEMLSSLGRDVINSRIIDVNVARNNDVFKMEIDSGVDSGSYEYRYDATNNEYKRWKKDASGEFVDEGVNFRTFDEITADVYKYSGERHNGRPVGVKFEANTASTRISKHGKNASNALPATTDYRSKVTRKRKAEEGKK